MPCVCMQAKMIDTGDSEDEAETKRQNSAAKLNLQATAFQTMGLAWPDSTHTQGYLIHSHNNTLEVYY